MQTHFPVFFQHMVWRFQIRMLFQKRDGSSPAKFIQLQSGYSYRRKYGSIRYYFDRNFFSFASLNNSVCVVAEKGSPTTKKATFSFFASSIMFSSPCSAVFLSAGTIFLP